MAKKHYHTHTHTMYIICIDWQTKQVISQTKRNEMKCFEWNKYKNVKDFFFLPLSLFFWQWI